MTTWTLQGWTTQTYYDPDYYDPETDQIGRYYTLVSSTALRIVVQDGVDGTLRVAPGSPAVAENVVLPGQLWHGQSLLVDPDDPVEGFFSTQMSLYWVDWTTAGATGRSLVLDVAVSWIPPDGIPQGPTNYSMIAFVGGDAHPGFATADEVFALDDQGREAPAPGLEMPLGLVPALTGTREDDHVQLWADGSAWAAGPGNDTLIGGYFGNDTMNGGLGNDLYEIRNAGDVITGEIGYAQGGGIDTVRSFVDYTAPTNVEILRLSSLGDSRNLNATGNDAPGTLVGNAGHNRLLGRGGNDQINGNDGADTLVGGVGRDTLVGGAGADRFVFTAVADSRATPAERDFINGFEHGLDRIDLSAIDANPFLTGDQAFRFIGNAAFGGDGAASAGELQFRAYGGNWNIVSIDRDGNGVAEMQIFVNLTNIMQGNDFIL